VYVKMDAQDQLLLSEGVCRQLGIIQYHPSVRPCEQRHSTTDPGRELSNTSQECVKHGDYALVPVVTVRLLQSVSLLPRQCTSVQVGVDRCNGLPTSGPLMFDPVESLPEGIQPEPSLLQIQGGGLPRDVPVSAHMCHVQVQRSQSPRV